jgi:hypothetical protein
MYAVQTERDAPIFIPEDNMTLHKALNRCNAAGICASPGGANTTLTIKTQQMNKVIEQYLLYGLVQASKTNVDIGDLIKSFVCHCDKTMVREAYHLTIREKMQLPAISDDIGSSWRQVQGIFCMRKSNDETMCFWIKILKPSSILRTTLLLYQFRIGYRTFVMLLLGSLKHRLNCASMFQT